jgi:hypothetical protein
MIAEGLVIDAALQQYLEVAYFQWVKQLQEQLG